MLSLSSSVQGHSCKKHIALTHRNAQESQTALLVGEILLPCGAGDEMSLMATLMASPAPEIQPDTQETWGPLVNLASEQQRHIPPRWNLTPSDLPGSPDRNQLLETL